MFFSYYIGLSKIFFFYEVSMLNYTILFKSILTEGLDFSRN